jgi:hypothetical protein
VANGKMTKPVFEIGDLVVKIYGRNPAKVIRKVTWNDNYYCKYEHSGACFEASARELKLYDTPDEEVMAETKTLYSFQKEDKTVGYGSHIGTNSSNQYLIEEKGTNTIHVFDPKDLEEVLPYTFSATMNGKETHYIASPGSLKKGDYLLYTSGSQPMIAVVTAVDTKNKAARTKFKGLRLMAEPI